jgi:uncharacterized protein (DUF1697 family)
MATFVVLLKGVNVGKARRVPMADFKGSLLELGCTKVTTLLNSGNAVIKHPKAEADALAKKIAAALARRFGFDVPVIVKSGTEFNCVVAENVLLVPAEEHPRVLVAFAQSKEALSALGTLSKYISEPEQFLLKGQAAYLYCAGGILDSQAAKAILGVIGKSVTTRNWATVLKLHALANSDA